MQQHCQYSTHAVRHAPRQEECFCPHQQLGRVQIHELLNKFGNLAVFRREALKQLSQLDQPLHSMHDLTTLLAPRIDILKSYIECVANCEEPEAFYTTTLSSALNKNHYPMPTCCCKHNIQILRYGQPDASCHFPFPCQLHLQHGKGLLQLPIGV